MGFMEGTGLAAHDELVVSNGDGTDARGFPFLQVDVTGEDLLGKESSTFVVRRVEDYLAGIDHQRSGDEFTLLDELCQALQGEYPQKTEFCRLVEHVGGRIADAGGRFVDD